MCTCCLVFYGCSFLLFCVLVGGCSVMEADGIRIEGIFVEEEKTLEFAGGFVMVVDLHSIKVYSAK